MRADMLQKYSQRHKTHAPVGTAGILRYRLTYSAENAKFAVATGVLKKSHRKIKLKNHIRDVKLDDQLVRRGQWI